jgi:DNA mismatch endonuclease (patch repair protein)
MGLNKQAHSSEKTERRGAKLASFKGLEPSCGSASRSKRANRKTGSVHEILLRAELTRLGLRFRKNVSTLLGVPDIVFQRSKIAVFCDGDFWHGRDWRKLRNKLLRRHNAEYWMAKISGNRKRDRKVTQELRRDGWLVLRLWETDIHHDVKSCALRIASAIARRKLR